MCCLFAALVLLGPAPPSSWWLFEPDAGRGVLAAFAS